MIYYINVSLIFELIVKEWSKGKKTLRQKSVTSPCDLLPKYYVATDLVI